MVGWYSTFGVCKDGSEIARFCSFKKKRCIKGRNWNLHNGKLQPPDHSDLRNVKVKVHPNSNGSLAECEAEMRKVDFAKLVIQTCPELKDFGVACTFIAEVNKDGNVHCAKFPKKKNKTVNDGTKVLIQDRFDGRIEVFLDLDKDNVLYHWDPRARSEFQHLVLASYKTSGGRCVISGIKGVRDYRTVKFLITSLTVHSVTGKEFGSKDKGNAGIQTFIREAGCALPTGLKDPEVFAEMLRAKAALREKPSKRICGESLCGGSLAEPGEDCASENSENNKCKRLPRNILMSFALKPSSVWTHHDNIRVFHGRKYDTDEY